MTVKQTGANNENSLLGTVDFGVKRIPDVRLTWEGTPTETGELISKNIFRVSPPIGAVMTGFDFDVKQKVTSFKITYVKNGSAISLVSETNRCTDEMLVLLKKLEAGEVFYIEDAVVEFINIDVSPRVMPPMKFEVL